MTKAFFYTAGLIVTGLGLAMVFPSVPDSQNQLAPSGSSLSGPPGLVKAARAFTAPILSLPRENLVTEPTPTVALTVPLAENAPRRPAKTDQIPANEQASFQAALQGARYGVYELTNAERKIRTDLNGVSHHATNAAQDLMFTFLDNGGLRVISGQAGKTWQAGIRLTGVEETDSSRSRTWTSEGIRATRESAGLTEWYENRKEGLEYGCLLTERPTGGGGQAHAGLAEGTPLVLRLSLDGLRADADPDRPGDLIFTDPATDQPVLGYRSLKVWDADGQPLAAEMRPASHGFLLAINDSSARYPVTIDPLLVSLEQRLQEPAGGPITYLKASNTGSADRFGGVMALAGDTLAVGAAGESSTAAGINGDQNNNGSLNSGAVYVFVRTAGTWQQQAYIKASNPGASYDYFGRSLALTGDTLVVGAPGEDSAATGINGSETDNSANNSGAAYVFIRSGSIWTQQAYLKASNTGADDEFGQSVTISGETVVVGARSEGSAATGVNGNQNSNAEPGSGAAYVFVRSGNIWTQQAYLKASNTGASDLFGEPVVLSGNILAIGATSEDSGATGVNGDGNNHSAGRSGAAYVFARSGGVWTQQAYLKASNTGAEDEFGSALALYGETLVVSAPYEDSDSQVINGAQFNNNASSSGAAYVFVRSGGTWSQQAYLKASNSQAEDVFGTSLALFRDTLVVGAWGEDSAAAGLNGSLYNNAASHSGAAYVLIRSGTTWKQQAYLKASNPGADDSFGASVAISGGTVVVSAINEDSAATGIDGDQTDNSSASAGAVYIYASGGGAANDKFGQSVDVDGDIAVVGAPAHDHLGMADTGKAWVFRRSGILWDLEAGLIHGDPHTNDRFGVAVAVSGERVVVGADYDDENGELRCGSATVFNRAGGAWRQEIIFAPALSGATFGRSVAVEGTTVIVGAPRADSGRGKIWSYRRGLIWQSVDITPNLPQEDSLFGHSVAISGDYLIVGSPRRDTITFDGTTTETGRVYFFKRNSSVLVQWDADGNNAPVLANFCAGFSVALDGNTAVVGCSGPSGWAGSGSDTGRSGRAYVVTRGLDSWGLSQQYLDNSGLPASAWFGMSVAVENGIIAVGAFGDEVTTGRVRLFQRDGSAWAKQHDLSAVSGESDNAYGISVALSGDTLLAGGYRADSAWVNSGMAWLYRLSDPANTIPVLNIAQSGGNAVLTWPAGTGLALWRSTSLTSGTWTKIVGSESLTTHSVAVSAAPRVFFRLAPP